MKFVKVLVLAILFVLVSTPTFAQHGGYRGGGGRYYGGYHGGLIAPLVIGGVLGYALAPRYEAPAPVYYPPWYENSPAPVYVAPPPAPQQYYCDAFHRYYSEVTPGSQCPYPGWRPVP